MAGSGTEATVDWRAPASDGGSAVLDYQVLVDGVPVGTGIETNEVVLTGLVPGRTYGIQLRARNTVGYGPAASRTFDTPQPPSTAPSAPRIGAATSGKKGGAATASVAWVPPASTGGEAVTGYVVVAYRVKNGRIVATFQSVPQAATARALRYRLAKGRYQFAVKARNAIGWSVLSSRSATVRAR